MKQLDLIDAHVGRQLRAARQRKGLSQEAVAQPCGITYQQVQKYEKGTNRISASRIVQFTELLDVPPSFFFDGATLQQERPS